MEETQRFKAVLFDMDGVIVDTEPLHKKAYHLMFEDYALDVSIDMYNGFTGQSTLNICKELVGHFNLECAPEELVKTKRKHFKYLFENDDDLQLIDGVFNLIKDYHKNGMTLILASSASMPNINRIFERFHLQSYFKAKFSGADLKQSKPHPEIFEKAADATGYLRQECFVIEDSTNGIKAAKGAGVYCIGFKSVHSKNQDYSLADMVISDFKEISFKNLLDIT